MIEKIKNINDLISFFIEEIKNIGFITSDNINFSYRKDNLFCENFFIRITDLTSSEFGYIIKLTQSKISNNVIVGGTLNITLIKNMYSMNYNIYNIKTLIDIIKNQGMIKSNLRINKLNKIKNLINTL